MNQPLIILGAGESGTGAALLAISKGLDVFVSDNKKIKDKYRKILIDNRISFEEEKHSKEIIEKADEIIISPGISKDTELLRNIKQKGINIISEIEFANRYSKAKKIAITGSNGKTTTTLLTHHILQKAGFDVAVAGNVGKSFAACLAERDYEYLVLEISSFQLDDIINFKPDITVLLNITPDHLDRYEYNFNNYINSKFRIISNQNEKDCFVYCLDDTTINKEIKNRNIAPKTYPFSIEKELKAEGAFLNKNNQIIININNDMTTIEYLALQGKHNVYNSMAAGICSKIFNIRKSVIQESLADYKNIEHRLESVANIVGIEFINDSKATNVNAAWWALETMHKPVIWIAGGLDKGNDYDSLKSIVAKKVKALICLGLDNTKLKMNFNDTINNISETNNMEDAVKMAYRLAKPGYVVLLSPACASFDLFIDYEDRGKQFKKAVRNL